MNFISSEFFLFCITVLILYRLAPDKWKAPLILLANAVFYGRLGWKSAVILAGEAGITYGIAQMTEKSTRRKKGWLIFGLAATLGTLAAFKYTNLAASWGSCAGISFFSFSLSAYLIDVYRDGAGGFPEILNLRESMVLILLEDIRISRGKRRFASIQHPAVFPILCAVLVCLILFLGQYGLGFQAQDFFFLRQTEYRADFLSRTRL